jgi:hypothetical protein
VIIITCNPYPCVPGLVRIDRLDLQCLLDSNQLLDVGILCTSFSAGLQALFNTETQPPYVMVKTLTHLILHSGRVCSTQEWKREGESDKRAPLAFPLNQFFPAPEFKIWKGALPGLQNLWKILRWQRRYRGTTFLLGSTIKSKRILNYEFGRKLDFDFGWNFKGLQTF